MSQMIHFLNAVRRFSSDERGVTAIEYALIAALVAVGIIAATTGLGDAISGLFNDIRTKLNAV